MEILRKPSNFGIFLKLLAAFLLIVLPLFGSIFYLNHKAEKEDYASLVLSLQDKTSGFLVSLDTEFGRIRNLQEGFINNHDLLTLSMSVDFLSPYEKYASLNRVQFGLQLIKNSNKYIKAASVYLPSIDRVMQPSLKYEAIDTEEYEALTAGIRARGFVFFHGGLYMTYTLPYQTQNGSSQMSAIAVEMDQQALRGELDNLEPGGSSVLIDGNGQWAIFGSALPATQENKEKLRKASVEEGGIASAKPVALEMDDTSYLMLRRHSDAYDYDLFTFVPKKQALGSLAKYNQWFWALAASSVLIIVFFSYWIYRVIHKPLSRLVRAFRRLEIGQLEIHLTYRGQDEFSYLYAQFNEMIKRLKWAIQEIYEQKLSVQRAELKQLQAQINPHFLYNTYFIMNQMVRTRDYDNLEPFSRHMGEYLQFVTRNIQEEIPLAREAAFMRTYVEIQTIRFENRIEADIGELPERFHSLMVPRLLLQPIVENAYKHGLERKPDGGRLSVSFLDAGDRLRIVIEDNGGIDPVRLAVLRSSLAERSESDEITGIVNVNQRLKLKYGDRSGIAVARNEEGGLRVMIDIPADGGGGNANV